jgi:hypothetical protein
MRGTVREISMPRRLVADLMHASIRVPFVSLARPLNVRPLLEARALSAKPPGWAAIFVKAFSLVAEDEPVLRTLSAKWPWPSFYELPRSIAMVAIARVENGQDCVLPLKVPAAVHFKLRRGRSGPDHRCLTPLGSPDYRRRSDRQSPDPAGTSAEHRDRGRIARSSAADGAQNRSGRSQPDRWPFRPSFRGVAAATNPESRDSGFDASHRPGMTVFIDMTSVSP